MKVKKFLTMFEKEEIDSKELEIGKEIEMEHASAIRDVLSRFVQGEELEELVNQLVEKTALDHLKENPRYYSEYLKSGLGHVHENQGSMSDLLLKAFSSVNSLKRKLITTGLSDHEAKEKVEKALELLGQVQNQLGK